MSTTLTCSALKLVSRLLEAKKKKGREKLLNKHSNQQEDKTTVYYSYLTSFLYEVLSFPSQLIRDQKASSPPKYFLKDI